MADLKKQWNSDVWNSASGFLLRFTDLMGDFRYSEKRHLPAINPSGRFQDPALRQFQNLVHQVEIALSDEDQDVFLSASVDLLDFSESIEIQTDQSREELEIIENLFAAVEPEVIYKNESNIEQWHIITSCQDSLIEAIKKNPSLVYSIDPRAFEELVAEIFQRNGFEVELTASTRDGGKDIIAVRRDMGIPTKHLIECKRYKQERKVTLDIVQRLYGVCYSNRANMGLVVTTSSFTKDAESFAGQHPWELALRDHHHLFNWIQQIPSKNFEADWRRRYAPHSAG